MNCLQIILVGLLLALPLGPNASQLKAQAKDKTVKLYVGLTDREGEIVTTIPSQELEVYEDGEPQKILTASHEDGPVSVGILIDISASQRKHFPAILDAVKSFIESSASEDEFFIATFGKEIKMISDFADRKTTLEKAVAPTFEKRSKVYDAIHYGLEKIQHGKFARRSLLLITDGQEDGSQISYGKLFKAIKESDTQIYCLGVGNTNSDEGEGPGNYQLGRLLLEEIATLTGGTAYLKDKPEQLRKEAGLIAQQLWHQYSVVYQHSRGGSEKKWRKIKVQVNPSASQGKMVIRAKRGYFPQ